MSGPIERPSPLPELRYERAPCGLLTILPTGHIQEINRTLLGWLGFTKPEVLRQKRFQDVLSVGGRIFFETHVAPLLRMQPSVAEVNFTIIRRDRSTFPALISAVGVRDAQGELTEIHLALFAIGDRKKYELELLLERKKAEQALRAKADFISLLTHEIRTPLNAIVGISHLLGQTQLSADQVQYAAMLASASETLMSLLNSILDYSKIDSGKAQIEARAFEFDRAIRTTALAFQAPARRKGIELSLEIGRDIPKFLLGDPVKIGQMITNLIGNAIKFTLTGSVTFTVEMVGQDPSHVDLNFEVLDTGIGIAEDIIPKIFEEYAQADVDTGRTFGGTGLGLAIVHRLAALHGSRISVSSALGVGSKFSFVLRLKVAEGPGLHGPDQPVIDGSLRGLRVLIADDSEDNQTIMRLTLEPWGVKVTSVLNGREVLAALDSNAFDVILMDLRMPILDGYATTAAIRKHPLPRVANIPIIAFSASATLGEQDIINQLQFQDVLGKPYKPHDLFAKIARLAHPAKPTSPEAG